jgi:hypothetical protein
MKNLREAKAHLARRGIVTLAEFVEAIAGEKPKGSWWSHPKGKLIFNVTSALEDEEGVVTCKLVDGKVTFVDPTLVPSLLAVVTNPKWRRARMSKLSPPAFRLFHRIDKELEITAKYKKFAAELAESLLVRSESRHTKSGRHATFLVHWRKVRGLPSFSEATAVLARHGIDLVESPP